MKTINLFGPLNMTGFGVHFTGWAGHLIPALRDRGIETSVNLIERVPFPEGTSLAPHIVGLLQRAGDPLAFDPKSPSISLWTLNDVSRFAGSPRILYTVFEGSELNMVQQANLKKVDFIFVPTEWHKERLSLYGVEDRVFVVPEGVDKDVFHFGEVGRKTEFSRPEDPDDILTFVSVGKLEKRKGMEVALEGLRDAALTTQRPMRILAQWFNQYIRSPRGENLWYRAVTKLLNAKGFVATESDVEASSRGEHMIRFAHQTAPHAFVDLLIGPVATQENLVQVYRSGNFGLFPHYAEGWGLPLHESMACGLPPITNNYSGPSEYLREGSYIPLESVTAIAKDGNPKEGLPSFFHGDVGTWQQVKAGSVSLAILRAVEMSTSERLELGRKASQAALNFTWKGSAIATTTALSKIGVL